MNENQEREALPLLIDLLARWEDANGTMAAIMDDEWAALCDKVRKTCVEQSPRQLRNEWQARAEQCHDAEALRSATKHDIRIDYGGSCEGQHHPGVIRATYPRPRTSLRGSVAVEYLPKSALTDPHPDGAHINMGRHYLDNYPGKYVVGVDAAVRQAIYLAIEAMHDPRATTLNLLR